MRTAEKEHLNAGGRMKGEEKMQNRSELLKALGIVFLGLIILGILGRMGHMLLGFIVLILSLIGAAVLFQRLTGIGFRLVSDREKPAESEKMDKKEQPKVKAPAQIPGPGEVLRSHCGTVNSGKSELCSVCGWPLPAKVQKAATGR